MERSAASLRRDATPSGLRIVDLPYAPEKLDGIAASEESSRASASRSRDALTTIDSTSTHVWNGERGTAHEVSSRYHSSELRRQNVATESRGPATTSSIDDALTRQENFTAPGASGLRADDAPATVDLLKGRLDSSALDASSRVNEAQSTLRQDSIRAPSDLRHAALEEELERRDLSSTLRTSAASAGAESLKASAHINESASATYTVVVLTVENVGQATIRAPIIRLALPTGVDYQGIAYGPAGTAASVVTTDEGNAVDVVVPMRVPSGHSRRVMLYLAPRRGVEMGTLHVQAFPQGTSHAPTSTGTVLDASTQEVSTDSVEGESKDP